MSHIMDGGYAFPSDSSTLQTRGMSLRDYFAAAALTGILSQTMDGERVVWDAGEAALEAYWHADAMLLELRKQPD